MTDNHDVEILSDTKLIYEYLLNNIERDYFFYTRKLDGMIVYVSSSVENVLGYDPSYFVQKKVSNHMIENVLNIFSEYFLEHKDPNVVKKTYVVNIPHKNSEIVNLELTELSVKDEFGRLIGMSGIAKDITNSIKAQKKIEEQNSELNSLNKILQGKVKQQILDEKNLFKKIFQKSSDATFLIRDKKFIDCNETIVEMLMYTKKESLLGLHPSKLCPEFQPDGNLSYDKSEKMMQIALEKGSNKFEWLCRKANGDTLWVEVEYTKINLYKDEVIHAIWKNIDDRKRMQIQLDELTKNLKCTIESENKKEKENVNLSLLNRTLQKKVEEESEKNREKDRIMFAQARHAQMGEMLSMIAHQWRQPLNAVSAAAINLTLMNELDMLESKEVHNISKFIQNSTQQMSETINDFMNFSKPEAENEFFTLKDVIIDIDHMIATQLKSHGIKFVTILNDEISIFGQKNELTHVLINVITNSRDALDGLMMEDKVIVLYAYRQDDNYIIEISDNGGGIDFDIMDKIFNPYFTTKDQGKGTGIGLHMAKEIIQKDFNGSISVQNIEEGAEFQIVLKIKGDDNE